MHRFTHLRRGFDLAALASVICATVPGAAFAGTATRTELEVVCTAPDVHLVQVRSGIHLALERAGKAPVAGRDFDLGFLSMPGCKIEPLLPSLRRAVSCGDHVTAGGDILYTGEPLGGGRRTTGGGVSYCDTPHYKKFGTEAVTVAKPSDLADPLAWSPILSDDGTAIAWIVADATSQQIRVRDLATGAERSIPLGTARDRSELLAAGIGVNQYLVTGNRNSVKAVDDSGTVKWGPIQIDAVENISLGFRRNDNDWLAWDITRLDDHFVRLQWSTARGGGRRQYELASFESVALDPSARWIAVSTRATGPLKQEESVALLRTDDGKDVFHRVLPRGTRARLAFLGSEYLAMSTRSGTEVMRLPAGDRAAHAVTGAAAEPTPTIDVGSAELRFLAQRAKNFGLELERPSAETAARLVGKWKARACGGESPFYEFRPDGKVYDPILERSYRYTVTDQRIEISDGSEIYQMSGGFYFPSFECGLQKLVRMEEGEDSRELLRGKASKEPSPPSAPVPAASPTARGTSASGERFRPLTLDSQRDTAYRRSPIRGDGREEEIVGAPFLQIEMPPLSAMFENQGFPSPALVDTREPRQVVARKLYNELPLASPDGHSVAFVESELEASAEKGPPSLRQRLIVYEIAERTSRIVLDRHDSAIGYFRWLADSTLFVQLVRSDNSELRERWFAWLQRDGSVMDWMTAPIAFAVADTAAVAYTRDGHHYFRRERGNEERLWFHCDDRQVHIIRYDPPEAVRAYTTRAGDIKLPCDQVCVSKAGWDALPKALDCGTSAPLR